MKNLSIFTIVLLLGAVLVGCEDEAPPGPSLGGTTVTKYVAIGNSLTAGYQSNALYASAQKYSFPKLIADQLKAAGANIGTFEQPTYGDPGNADPATGKAARYEIISFSGPVVGPRGLTPGVPTNTALARPYDNLGLPGAPLAGFTDTVGGPYQGSFGALVIRGAGGLPKTQLASATALNPDLVTFWLGANDVLGYATSGGALYAVTPGATFSALYSGALTALRTALPNAKIVVATIPEVTAIPFFTTAGPRIRASLASVFAAGGSLVYQKAGETGTGTGTTKLDEASGGPLITLTGNTYATLIGQPTYTPYRAIFASLGGYAAAQSVGIDSTKPFGLDPANPWPNAYVLDATEQANVANGIAAFNTAIRSAAAAAGAKVFDAHAFFNDVKAHGYTVSGQEFTTDYISGGLFSLDGVHPSSRGYGIIANKFIEVMNNEFGTAIPAVDVLAIPGLAVTGFRVTPDAALRVDPSMEASFREIFKPSLEQ